jgi:23S rRNA pseudouridine1911/1915/1917 synthase
VGDPEYGVPGYGLARQFLHAAGLSFTHPVTGERIELASELPEDLATALVNAR